MNLSEFGAVINFVLEKYTSQALDAKYTEIETLIDQNRATPTDELSTQLKEKIEEILKLQDSIEPVGWSYSKYKYFEKLGAHQYFGVGARVSINKIMKDGYGDSGYVTRRFKEMHTGLSDFIKRITQIKESMGDLIKDSIVTLENDRAVMQLVFDEKVDVNTIDELNSQADKWAKILSWFTDAIIDDHASAKVISISKESPLTIVIDGPLSVIAQVGGVAQAILLLYLTCLNIEESRLRIKKAKTEDPGGLIDDAHKKQYESVLKRGLIKIKKDISKHLKKDADGGKTTAVSMAIDMLKDFIFGGGRADYASEVDQDNIPQDDKGPRKGIGYKFQLAPVYKDVRQKEILIYKNQKLLEPVPEPKVEKAFSKDAEVKIDEVVSEVKDTLQQAETP